VQVRTGTAADAGIGHNAYFYFVGSDTSADPDQGARYPEERRGYFELNGPFHYASESKPASFEVPASFKIKGVVLYNPDDTSPAGRFSAWLANALDKDNKTLGVNWLNLAVKRYGQTWITSGQWYVNDVLVDGQEFPVYSWVLDNESQIAFTGEAHLPQDTPPGLRHWRRLKLIQNQDVYAYQPYNDLGLPADNTDVNSSGYRPTLDPYPAHQSVERSGPKLEQVPKDEQFKLDKRYDFGQYTITSVLTALLSDPRALFLKIASSFRFYPQLPPYKTVEEYTRKVFEGLVHYTKPFVLKYMDWWSDKAFGWQTVAGINPIQIAKVASAEDLPSTITYSELDEALKARLAQAGTTLEAAIKAGKIYKLDFTFLEAFQGVVNNHVERKEKTEDHGTYKIKTLGKDVWDPIKFSQPRHLHAPAAILFVDPDPEYENIPVPVAIKLERGTPLITGKSGPDLQSTDWGWTLAKAIVFNADSGTHQLVTHWLKCHACSETVLVAIRRQLSELHPLFKLLLPHFRYTMNINSRARGQLIPAQGTVETNFTPGPYSMQVSAFGYRFWNLKDEALPEGLKKRGVTKESGALPNYPYRDYGLKMWDAIEAYVTEYVELYYGAEGAESEKKIAGDAELQAFWADYKRGHGSLDTWLKENGTPEGLEWPALKTTKDLARILTTWIWVASCQHSAVNFNQYDYSAFVPNHPASIRKQYPYGKKIDETTFMDLMPPPPENWKVMTVVQTLVSKSVEEQFIGEKPDQYSENWFLDAKAKAIYDRFGDRIDQVQKELEALNEDSFVPYNYLIPKKSANPNKELLPFSFGIPNSVAI